jgi:predicted negative regulator of RcsB-dependent stress response
MTGAHAMATTGTSALASGGTNLTAVGIILGIFIPICGAVAVIVWAYFRLQRHRADAVAMAAYRKLAEDAVANQQELRAALEKLTEHVQSVEQLMRDVG